QASPELILLDLRGRHGPFGDEAYVPRGFEAGDVLAAESDEILLADALSREQLDERGRNLDVLGVRNAHCLSKLDGRVAREMSFDFRRSHILAADFQHVLRTAVEHHVPAAVDRAQITGMKPTLRIEG